MFAGFTVSSERARFGLPPLTGVLKLHVPAQESVGGGVTHPSMLLFLQIHYSTA